MTEKEKYRLLCNQVSEIPIFSQDWWLDSVCGEENWNIFLIEKNNIIKGALPYYLAKNTNKIQKAPFTQNSYLYIDYPKNLKYERKINLLKKINKEIIEKIEKLKLDEYRQYFHWSYKFWLPFYWQGYNQTTRYTHRIDTNLELEEIESNFNTNIRKNIRKAEKVIEIKEDLDPEVFYSLCDQTYKRQGLKVPFTFEVYSKIYIKTKKRDQSKILYAKDINNNIHSAALFVWDKESLYYLFSGSNINFRSSQSLTLLLYEGIKLAKKLGKTFDFEGSMKENIEKSFSQFGGKAVPYFDIKKKFNKGE